MKQTQVPPDIAFTICGLFSDPNDVYAKAKEYYGDNLWKSENPIDNSQNIDNTDDNDSEEENKLDKEDEKKDNQNSKNIISAKEG